MNFANAPELVAELRECSRRKDLSGGIKLHKQALEFGFIPSNIHVVTSLMNMYSKCGDLSQAQRLFDTFPEHRNVVSWNCIIQANADNGKTHRAHALFQQMQSSCTPNSRTFAALLSACSSETSPCLESIKAIHSAAESSGFCDKFVASRLIDLYSKCASMIDARRVFDSMPDRDVVSWTSIIHGYASNGYPDLALELFHLMLQFCQPNARTFVSAFVACSKLISRSICLEAGKWIHALALKSEFFQDIYLQNSLVDFYSKCQRMVEARLVFDAMAFQDPISWTALLQGYAEFGDFIRVLRMFREMGESLCEPDARAFLCALTACSELRLLDSGRSLYLQAVRRGCCNLHLQNKAVTMYSKCGRIDEARGIFESLPDRDLVSWNSYLLGCIECGEDESVLELLPELQLQPDRHTLAAGIIACGNLHKLDRGRLIHAEAARLGLDQIEAVAAALIDFYAKCGNVSAARLVFDRIENDLTSVSWSAMMLGYSRSGDAEGVFEVFEAMRNEGIEVDSVSVGHLLAACSHGGLITSGKRVLEVMEQKFGVSPNVIHYTSVIDMLARGNQVEAAELMMKSMPLKADEISWTALLGGKTRV